MWPPSKDDFLDLYKKWHLDGDQIVWYVILRSSCFCFTSYIAKDALHTRISPHQRYVQSESVPNNDHQITHHALFRSAAVLYQAQHLILWTTKDALLTTYTLCRSPKMHPATIKLCVRHFYAQQLFNKLWLRISHPTLPSHFASPKMQHTHFKHIVHLKRCIWPNCSMLGCPMLALNISYCTSP